MTDKIRFYIQNIYAKKISDQYNVFISELR